jgi:hypothetical protein
MFASTLLIGPRLSPFMDHPGSPRRAVSTTRGTEFNRVGAPDGGYASQRSPHTQIYAIVGKDSKAVKFRCQAHDGLTISRSQTFRVILPGTARSPKSRPLVTILCALCASARGSDGCGRFSFCLAPASLKTQSSQRIFLDGRQIGDRHSWECRYGTNRDRYRPRR